MARKKKNDNIKNPNQKRCLDKTIFWSVTAAFAKAADIKEKTGINMGYYYCSNCFQWHLTNNDKRDLKLKEQQNSILVD